MDRARSLRRLEDVKEPYLHEMRRGAELRETARELCVWAQLVREESATFRERWLRRA